jgi:hypothetical protein
MITKKHKRMNTSFSIKIKIKNHPHSLHFLCQTPKPTLTLIAANSNPFTLNLSSPPTTISSLQTSNLVNIRNSPLHHSLQTQIASLFRVVQAQIETQTENTPADATGQWYGYGGFGLLLLFSLLWYYHISKSIIKMLFGFICL